MKKSIFAVILCFSAAAAHAGAVALDELNAAAGGAFFAVPSPAPAPAPAPAVTPAPKLPDELILRERVVSLTDTFDLKVGTATYGTITAKFFSLTKAFTYTDAQGRCVANARARFFSWGAHIDVTDCADRPIGAIKENVLKSLFKVWTTYSILDAQSEEIAVSDKVEWISTTLTVSRAGGGVIAELKRSWLNVLNDKWTVKIRDHSVVDSRLLVMIAAYKTSVDNDRRAEVSKSR